jgi:hypothetical protein
MPGASTTVMVGKVRTLLGRRFEVRPVTYRRAAFAKGSWGGIGAMVREGVTPAPVDAYVVITRGFSQLGATNQSVSGLGILEASGGLLNSSRFFCIRFTQSASSTRASSRRRLLRPR